MKRVRFFLRGIVAVAASCSLSVIPLTQAFAAEGNFSLQVTPSPLVATVKPGVPTVLDLKIRNASTAPEDLRIQARAFKVDTVSGEIVLDETKPPEIMPWLSFSAPTFTVKPGEWYTEKVRIALPKETGFSYSFALQITRKDTPTTSTGGRLLQGSIAVFTLINVDRPGATKKVDLVSFKSDQSVYEYLPSTLNIRLKNSGNTIVQPYGNVYIQRDSASTTALTTLPVNAAQAYLLPGSERTLKASWTDGFPVYKQVAVADDTQKSSLSWNFDKISHFRFGRYTAKVVAVYNDGTRDVPITGEVTFWVIPWKAILLALGVIVALFFLFRLYIRSRTEKAVKKALQAHKKD